MQASRQAGGKWPRSSGSRDVQTQTTEGHLTDVWITPVKCFKARDFAAVQDACVTCRNRFRLYSSGPSEAPVFFATTSLRRDLGQ